MSYINPAVCCAVKGAVRLNVSMNVSLPSITEVDAVERLRASINTKFSVVDKNSKSVVKEELALILFLASAVIDAVCVRSACANLMTLSSLVIAALLVCDDC